MDARALPILPLCLGCWTVALPLRTLPVRLRRNRSRRRNRRPSTPVPLVLHGFHPPTTSSQVGDPIRQVRFPIEPICILLIDFLGPPSFLTNPVWKSIGRRHIRVQFNTKFQGGGLDRRQGLTQYPLRFNYTGRQVSLYWSDNKSIWRSGDVPLDCLTPAVPQKQGGYGMVLSGAHQGEIAKVQKVVRKSRTVVLRDMSQTRPAWEENMDNVCLVEDHIASQCTCSQN
jgi:hypothetical protein